MSKSDELRLMFASGAGEDDRSPDIFFKGCISTSIDGGGGDAVDTTDSPCERVCEGGGDINVVGVLGTIDLRSGDGCFGA